MILNVFRLLKNLLLLSLVIYSLILLVGCKEEAPPPSFLEDAFKQSENPAASLPKVEKNLPPLSQKSIRVLPEQIKFGEIAAKEHSYQKIGVFNEGQEALAITEMNILGNETAFEITTGTCRAQLMLKPGESCEVTIGIRAEKAGGFIAEWQVSFDKIPMKTVPLSVTINPAPLPPISPLVKHILKERRTRAKQLVILQQGEAVDTMPPQAGEIQDHYPEGLFESSHSTLAVDRSRILTADRYIPAILENTINSELSEGRIIAVVERNVFGSDNRNVLIPASSRVIGNYTSLKRQGDTRLMVLWHRIIRPDGVSLKVHAQGSDMMGRLGLIGNVDSRFFHKYGSSLLTSIISILPEYYLGESQTNVISNTDIASTTTGKTRAVEQFSKDMSFLARRMIEENLRLEPVITVPQGTKLLITPQEDLYFTKASPNPMSVLPVLGQGQVMSHPPAIMPTSSHKAALLPAVTPQTSSQELSAVRQMAPRQREESLIKLYQE